MNTNTTSRAFFDAIYERSPDPWSFASSSYELGRYERILRALPRSRYKRAFEPGCSIGVLTERLALICDEVEAMEISCIAVDRARQRCSAQTNVHIVCAAMPDHMPIGEFDLVVFSEIGYYFVESQLASLIDRLISQISLWRDISCCTLARLVSRSSSERGSCPSGHLEYQGAESGTLGTSRRFPS